MNEPNDGSYIAASSVIMLCVDKLWRKSEILRHWKMLVFGHCKLFRYKSAEIRSVSNAALWADWLGTSLTGHGLVDSEKKSRKLWIRVWSIPSKQLMCVRWGMVAELLETFSVLWDGKPTAHLGLRDHWLFLPKLLSSSKNVSRCTDVQPSFSGNLLHEPFWIRCDPSPIHLRMLRLCSKWWIGLPMTLVRLKSPHLKSPKWGDFSCRTQCEGGTDGTGATYSYVLSRIQSQIGPCCTGFPVADGSEIPHWHGHSSA